MFIPTLFAGTIDPANKDEQYLRYAEKYGCVVRLVSKSKSNIIATSSSAVILNSQWVLTAAHIVDNSVDSFFVLIDADTYKVQKIFAHPNFNRAIVGKYDIALLKLEKPVVKSIQYPTLYSKFDEINKRVDIVGYGMSGNFNTGAKKKDFKKRAGHNHVDHIYKDMLICGAEKPPRSSLEILTSHGDSGGGLFIDKKLAGINSLLRSSDGKTDSSWSDESGHTRISMFYAWIHQIMSQN